MFCAIGFHTGIVTSHRIPAVDEALLRSVEDSSSASSGAVERTLGVGISFLRLLDEMHFGKLLHTAIEFHIESSHG